MDSTTTTSAGMKRNSMGDVVISSHQNNTNNNGKQQNGGKRRECPYLDTINRSLLDFDFEPSCSVSMETGPHVYGCLVCGKFFRGRGKQTPAYTHAVDEGHFVFVHLTKGTFHCLPDDYIIDDPSLADISAALHPTYTPHEIQTIDDNTGLSRDLFGRRYLPGYVGLNNLNKTDYINATVQALAHVRPLRDYFLRLTHRDVYAKSTSSTNNKVIQNSKKPKKIKAPHRMSDLVLCFGELIRKMWSHQRFKSHVDPHMFVQAVSASSKKRFEVGKQAEIGEFMAWLLHQLHIGLGGSKTKPKTSIIQRTFQGNVEVTTIDPRRQTAVKTDGDDMAVESNGNNESSDTPIAETVTNTTFLQLTLDMAEKPLFRDDEGGLVIPQEPLVNVMKKFDGNFSDALSKSGVLQQKRYRLKELPPYLIVHLARFKTNNYSREKNPTIVAFPVKNLDLSPYTFPDGADSNGKKKQPPTEEEIRSMSVKELRALLTKYGQNDVADTATEKSELIEAAIDFVSKRLGDLLEDKYDLVANITHDSPADVGREGKYDPLQEGSYKCHVQHRATNQWYQMQDLHVEPTMPQLIGVSESYLLIFERKSAQLHKE